MSDKKYLEFLKGSNEFQLVEVEVRDPDNVFIEMLRYIGGAANVGHSFDVIVDPDDPEGREKFFIDGDGSFYLKKIKVNGNKI